MEKIVNPVVYPVLVEMGWFTARRKVIRNIVFMFNSLASLTEPLVLEDDIPSNLFLMINVKLLMLWLSTSLFSKIVEKPPKK
jgi:hypothetical protein